MSNWLQHLTIGPTSPFSPFSPCGPGSPCKKQMNILVFMCIYNNGNAHIFIYYNTLTSATVRINVQRHTVAMRHRNGPSDEKRRIIWLRSSYRRTAIMLHFRIGGERQKGHMANERSTGGVQECLLSFTVCHLEIQESS